ncbi:MAG TPA: hypothetical protein VNK70_01425 [Candidatus Paceibacterota bacterium]|nr:hypothetical protein [Candidatus Paceibacterota bacterium]
MKLKPTSNAAIFVVLLVILGLVLAYVPLLFKPRTNPSVETAPAGPGLNASLVPQEATSTTEEQKEPLPTPSGFEGLEEESNSLDGLLGQ